MTIQSSTFRRRVLLVVVLLCVLAPARALAIPAFARRYQTSCTTCHVLIPKLNAFGIAFRNNGYRIPPNDERYVRIPDVQLGAPAWKRLWPDAVWPGGIAGAAPVAFRLLNDVVVNPDRPVQLDFVFPNEFEVLAGGTAGEGISYFAELVVTHDGNVGLERAFLQFDHIGGTTLANLVVGRFEIRAVPFSRFHRRLTSSDFMAMDFRNPSDGLRLGRPQEGFEFWGAKSGRAGRGGIDYAVGIVNGTGSSPETNTAKDVYTRLSYKFGGFGVTGSDGTDTRELPAGTRSWRDNSVKIGMSSYVGRADVGGGADRLWRLGGDADAFIGALNVSAVVLRGRDQIEAARTEFTTASAEANYVVKPWIVAIFRYDAVWQDAGRDIQRLVPGVALAIRANVRAVAEWEAFQKTSFDGVRQASGDSRARFRLDIAF